MLATELFSENVFNETKLSRITKTDQDKQQCFGDLLTLIRAKVKEEECTGTCFETFLACPQRSGVNGDEIAHDLILNYSKFTHST